jgi:DNA-binding response OmpR family regulator
MLTGSAEQENVRRASMLHANGYLIKPFQAASLVERLRAMLATE